MDQPIRPKPEKPRVSVSRAGYFDEKGQWQRFLLVTKNGRPVALVQTIAEAFEHASCYGAAA